MRKFAIALLFCAVCFTASAVSFQTKNDYLFSRNYYNPATRFLNDGIYAQGLGMYTLNMPMLSGKEPFDLDLNLMVARDNYSVFASVTTEEYSYFSSQCLSAGYNHIFRFGDNHSLRVGGRAVLGLNSVDFYHLPYELPEYTLKSRILLTPDMDLGIEYSYRFFHIGAAVKNVFAYEAKFKGVTYVSWPRSYMMHMRFDSCLANDNVHLEPYVVLGLNQNIYFVAGMDMTFWKNYRVSYSFRGPDLHHNINASVNICDRVILNAGYSVSTAHEYSSVYGGITVRLAK